MSFVSMVIEAMSCVSVVIEAMSYATLTMELQGTLWVYMVKEPTSRLEALAVSMVTKALRGQKR